MKPLLLCVALTLCTATAFAQDAGAPRGPVPVVEADLPMPALPVVPPALAARVQAQGRLLDRTLGCMNSTREGHRNDPRCASWTAALRRGGAASAHAIGQSLAAEFVVSEDHEEPGESSHYEVLLTRERTVASLAAADGPLAVEYLLYYMGRELQLGRGFTSQTTWAAMLSLHRLLGVDLSGIGSWEGEAARADPARMALAYQRWLRWRRDVAALPAPERIARALQHHREALRSGDVPAQFVAMQALVGVRGERGAVTVALRALLARADLPAEARPEIVRWARRNRLGG